MTNDKKLCDCEIPSMGNLIGVGNDGCCTKCNRQIYSPEPNAHVLNTYDSIVEQRDRAVELLEVYWGHADTYTNPSDETQVEVLRFLKELKDKEKQ